MVFDTYPEYRLGKENLENYLKGIFPENHADIKVEVSSETEVLWGSYPRD